MAAKMWVRLGATVVALVVGWQANHYVDARSAGKKICLTDEGQILRKRLCSPGETDIAVAKARKTPIKKLMVERGSNTLAPSNVRGPVSQAENLGSGTTTLMGLVGSSLRSYTYNLSFPENWTGSITTNCAPDETPVQALVTYFVDGKRVDYAEVSDPEQIFWTVGYGQLFQVRTIIKGEDPDGNIIGYPLVGSYDFTYDFEFSQRYRRARIVSARDNGQNFLDGRYNNDAEWDTDWYLIPFGPELSVYVTQICAPLTNLQDVG